uniref:DENN domain-containing protein 1A n=1 Tax=Cacopsylla melanoneura TaxID=428564 RepID=A0A8D8VF61_9HEMI
MGSRLRDNVKHLFECFCEVARPQGEEPAWVLQKFPSTYKDESVLKQVPNFAYPCELKNSSVEYYTFVLTDLDSKWKFGYCRHDPKYETVLVVLSYLPWHESFYKLLQCISEIMNGSASSSVWSFLEKIMQSDVPEYGNNIRVTCKEVEFTCTAPNQFQLPSIPENKNLTEYCAIEPVNMLQIFASMLYERRIAFTSKRLSRLSACVQAANAVIYPMSWQHIFIPVLPHHLTDYLNAPMPYLIGIPEQLLDKVRLSDLGDIVLLNTDTNVLTTQHNDLASLPPDVIATLKRQLRNKTTGDGVSRAFLRALVQLIGGYRDALKFHQGEKITFNKEAFVESRPSAMQPFLRKMLDLQIFQQFIEERLEMLNSGMGFSDEFELEACNYTPSSTIKVKYKEWMHTFSKDGRAFFKNVRSRVRERGKGVYKGLRSRLKEEKTGENKSNSAPSSPTQLRKKDISMPLQSNKYSALDLASSPDLSPLDINLDLMSDLQHVIFKDCSPSHVQKTLSNAAHPLDPPPPLPSKPKTPEQDLIRLDSISSMDGVLPSPSSCAGVENPLYPYFEPSGGSTTPQAPTSSNFKQHVDFFNNLHTSPSFSLKSPPRTKQIKPFSFSDKEQDEASLDFLTSSTNSQQMNGFQSSISESLQYNNSPKVLSTFMSPTPPVLSPRKLSNTTESKPSLPAFSNTMYPYVLPKNTQETSGGSSSNFRPSLPYRPSTLNNGFSSAVQPTSNTSLLNTESKDLLTSLLNNNNNNAPNFSNGSAPNGGAPLSFKPTSSTYASRAAFLHDQLGPAPSIAPKKSVSEWTKFE